MPFHWKIDECAVYFDRLLLRGWCHDPEKRVVKIEAVFPDSAPALALSRFAQPSPDVAAAVDPSAHHSRFDEWLTPPAEILGRDFSLRFTFDDGSSILGESVQMCAAQGDPFHSSWVRFLARLHEIKSGAILEIGSRARSAVTQRHHLPAHLDYVGLDILPGPNVDVVGDAHRLEELFGRNRFAAIFSIAVFEHLAMPWKVALEINRVLAPGGIVFTGSNQTWPMHEEPWDFFRFSQHSWKTLFNHATGFEVIETAAGEPARIYPCRTLTSTKALPDSLGYLGSSVIARKISDTALSWPVSIETASSGEYPKGELVVAP